MPVVLRVLAVDQQLAEIAAAQDVAKGAARLAQDLRTVGDEQEGGVRRPAPLPPQALVIKRRYEGLTGTGRRHNKIAAAAVDGPLAVEVVQHLLLKRVRMHVYRGQRAVLVTVRVGVDNARARAGAGQRLAQALLNHAVLRRVVRLEAVVRRRPVRLERGAEFIDELRDLSPGHPDVPLLPVDHRGLRQVRRADICRCEARFALEEPALSVQPREPPVEANFDLGADANELVNGSLLASPQVRRRQNSHRDTASDVTR